MSEIKPVAYISNDAKLPLVEDGQYWLYEKQGDCLVALYPESAIESLQKQNAELKAEDEISAAVIEKCSNLLAQIAITLKGEPDELTRHGYHDLPELVSVLHVENELNKQIIAKFEQILEGVPEGAFDGGWTARGIMKHAADLEKANAAQAKRIAELEEDLQFVERWANHHGTKPNVTAQEALSCIQHYPSIAAITKSYKDGVIPDTRNPYAEIESLHKQVEMLLGSARKTVLALAHASIHDPLYTAAYDELSESIKLASKNGE